MWNSNWVVDGKIEHGACLIRKWCSSIKLTFKKKITLVSPLDVVPDQSEVKL